MSISSLFTRWVLTPLQETRARHRALEDALMLYQYAQVTAMEYGCTGRLEDLEKVVQIGRAALWQLPDNNPGVQYSASGQLVTALHAYFQFTKQQDLLDEIIHLYSSMLELPRASYSNERPAIFNNLSTILLMRFEYSGQQEDVDMAISCSRDALALHPVGDADRHTSLDHLSYALKIRFEQRGRYEDLDEALSLSREALRLLPANNHDLRQYLKVVGDLLHTRFEHFGHRKDLDESISLHQNAHQLRPPSTLQWFECLISFANALHTRFIQESRRDDLDRAILLFENALELITEFHPGRSNNLGGLAVVLRVRYDQSGRREDLDKSILLDREALSLRPAPHPERSLSLNNLAHGLMERFELEGRSEDLNEAIWLYQDAVTLRPTSHPDRFRSISNLAGALGERFPQLGQHDDLDGMILSLRDALKMTPQSHTDRLTIINNLAAALSSRFEETGRRQDLDEAISFYRDVLELRPAGHFKYHKSFNMLAGALYNRYMHSGRSEDLDEATSLMRNAFELLPATHCDRANCINNLACVLSYQDENLDEVVSLHRDALELRPEPHRSRVRSLIHLANSLAERFSTESVQWQDLDEAILLYRNALELTPAPHSQRPRALNGLATALFCRFGWSAQSEDLDEAIHALNQSLDALPSTHPSTCKFSYNLGTIYMAGYSHTQQPEYLDKAVVAFRTAVQCQSSPLSARIDSAKEWAWITDPRHESAMDAYCAAIELLPRLAMLGLDLQSRQQALVSSGDGIARDAAACAIRLGLFEKAIEVLEEGRAVFWSQALQLRTPMDDLRDVAPELEMQLRHVSQALEQGSFRDMALGDGLSSTVKSIEQEASHFRRLDDDWLARVEEVRQLEGFQDFLRPKRFPTLQTAAAKGPVVILNTGKSGSDALIMTSSGVKHIPLPYMGTAKIYHLVQLTRAASKGILSEADHTVINGFIQQVEGVSDTLRFLTMRDDGRHIGRTSGAAIQPDDIFRFVLAELWLSVAKPVIHSLDLERYGTLPALWWCPTGPFAFLPIHAAGLYDAQTTESISDYVVSSYTPTISALLTTMPPPSSSFKMIAVIQPQSLPYTVQELQRIESRVPERFLVKLGIPGTPASVDGVVGHLSTTSIAHFACHGHQDVRSPLNSSLILDDGQLKVSRIMQQPMPNASLAFLCACETAMGDENLPDEAIHIGATLLFAGFRGVVATMWSIADADGPKIADTFYENLFTTGNSHSMSGPDTMQAARALRLAVVKLRSENTSFARWVPFVYLGR